MLNRKFSLKDKLSEQRRALDAEREALDKEAKRAPKITKPKH